MEIVFDQFSKETKMLDNSHGSRQPDSQGESFLQSTKLRSYLDIAHVGKEKSNLNVWVSAKPGGGLAVLDHMACLQRKGLLC